MTKVLENGLLDDIENDDTLSFLGARGAGNTIFSFPSV